MKRYYGAKQNVTKPVEKITLDDRTVSKKRIFFIALFLCIGFGAFAYAFTHLGRSEKGWQKVTIDIGTEESSYYDFTLMYEFGKGEKSAKRERRELSETYGNLTRKAFILFDRSKEYDGFSNLCTVNRHPNETVTVASDLYKAFEKFASYNDSRILYLGALTEHVEALVSSDSAEALSEYDPYTNESVREFFNKTAGFAMDRDAVQLELCGDNRVILHVSDDYLTFAGENGIVNFIDFGWTKNAVICDYLADTLIGKGFNNGILTSYDGFTRNFCASEKAFDYALVFFEDGEPRTSGAMNYQGKKNFVWFHDYPMHTFDGMGRVLMLQDGNKRHTYLGTDGLPHSALSELLAWSEADSCTDIALSMAKYYITDHYSGDDLRAGAGAKGISVLTAEEAGLLHTNDWNVTFDGNTRTIVRVPYSVE